MGSKKQGEPHPFSSTDKEESGVLFDNALFPTTM
jgi:hypothetical protein